MTATVHLGFEVGSGEPVAVPVQHLAVTGQTQQSGKTTTLEALVARSGLSAVAFVTKRAEASFTGRHQFIRPYFKHSADWQFVAAILEATLRERLKFERSWIMRACRGAKSLADVQRNVRRAMDKAKGMSADVYLTLDHYLDIVVPQIALLPYSDTLALGPGLNVMDLSPYTTELQSLVIRSVLEWVYTHGSGVLVIIPEAWEFVPQNRGSPVLLACEQLIRKGGAARNFVWLDSQDIAGVHKNILRQVGVWIIGVQREANEVKRALAHIPGSVRKPSVTDVMQLERGQFFACFGRTVAKVYVQPAWMQAAVARDIARGIFKGRINAVDEKEAAELRAENASLKVRVAELERLIANARDDAPRPALDIFKNPPRSLADMEKGTPPNQDTAGKPPAAPLMPPNVDALYDEIRRRLMEDQPALLKLAVTKPEIEVTVAKRTVEASDETLIGRLAVLISEGFFDEPRAAYAAYLELKRRGQSTARPNVYREVEKLTSLGFLTKESEGYQTVQGMKVRIIDQKAAA